MNSAFDRLSTPAASSVKLEAAMTSHQSQQHTQNMSEDQDGRPYYGKCQYKTGKCFNERTLKRNGEVHSLCEEHRIKQNLIQRRSDRKYQTVHAIRRRERSQRRAVLKKQVSMAVAQQLFYEHQQQKTLGVQLATSHQNPHQPQPLSQPPHQSQHQQLPSLSSLATGLSSTSTSVASLAPPIQIPGKMDFNTAFLPSDEGLASPILSFSAPSAFANTTGGSRGDGSKMGENEDDSEGEEDLDDGADDDEAMDVKPEPSRHHSRRSKPSRRHSRTRARNNTRSMDTKPEDATPTGIDDFTPESFLSICCSEESTDAPFSNFAPILTARAERELWTEADIDFLQTLLLA